MLFRNSTWEIAQGAAHIGSPCMTPPLLGLLSPLHEVLLLLPAFSCTLQAQWHWLLLVTYLVKVTDYDVCLMGWWRADLPFQSSRSLWQNGKMAKCFSSSGFHCESPRQVRSAVTDVNKSKLCFWPWQTLTKCKISGSRSVKALCLSLMSMYSSFIVCFSHFTSVASIEVLPFKCNNLLTSEKMHKCRIFNLILKSRKCDLLLQ